MGRLFGTDGVRGVAGRDLTARLAMDLASAAAAVLGDAGEFAAAAQAGRRPAAVVGRDPRASGEFLEAAVVAGLAGMGVDVMRLGVTPTPAVAYLTGALGADFGVMLSASHNPAQDNGIKFFSRGGYKLPDPVEDAIERRLGDLAAAQTPAPGFGRVTDAPQARDRYLEHLVSSLPGGGTGGPIAAAGDGLLAGLRIVVDCAHGAAYDVAPEAFRRAGAEVVAIGAQPDGLNINEACGSTHLDALIAEVVARGADAGIAHDGDADRCLAVTSDGQVVDGDQILAILAVELKEAHRLAGDTVVATVMSNLGFHRAMEDAGIQVVETAVGDRYVLEAMQAGGYVLGGEQSGHIIMLEHATTGDGLLTALHLLGATARRGLALGELAKVMQRFPQVLINVPEVDKSLVNSSPGLAAAVAAAEAELGASGRVLIRPSGTEPAVRVMVEAAGEEQAQRIASHLAEVVRTDLG
ncbi:MAG TPA: phosphoglucosamine mutase [Streptosporangiaceae bacterium]|nr:phosphoglucosamine mutase [Streptosporangiaceae bacterium]